MKKYKVLLSCSRIAIFLAALLLLLPLPASATFLIHPSLAVSEEYIDNIFETKNNKKDDFVTRLMPGIALEYNAPIWDWNLSYFFDFRNYAKNNRDNEYTHNLNVHGLTRVIRDVFFWDVTENYSRVSLNVARDTTRDSLYANQSDSNTFTTSPYFNFTLGSKTTLRTGYRYVNVWYKEAEGIDRRDHMGFADLTYAYSPRLNFTASYLYTLENSRAPYNRHNSYVGFRYEYKERSFIFGQGGYTWFSSRGHGSLNSPFWNAGLTHVLGTYTFSLNTGVQYPVDPLSGVTKETDYGLSVIKEINRGSVELALSYAKYSGDNVDVDTDSRYGAGMTVRYALGARLQGMLMAGVERYNHRTTNTYTRRISVNPSLSYPLPYDITLSLNYMFIDYYSPLLADDNFTVNRVILEARKSF